jgi:hypothetical protein
MPEPAYLTLSQVALRTGRHPELLRQWCARGRVPCTRVGGSWVIREEDLGLVDGIARRSRQPRPGPAAVEHPDRTRIIAAVFDDERLAASAADALRERLHISDDAVATTSIGLTALAPLRLTLVAGRFSDPASVDGRRILVGYGGRIVADTDDASAAEGRARADARAVRGPSKRANRDDRGSSRAAPR